MSSTYVVGQRRRVWVNLIDVAENYAHVDQPRPDNRNELGGGRKGGGIRFGFGLLSKRISINYILS